MIRTILEVLHQLSALGVMDRLAIAADAIQ
jgi:hypothetical protein